MTHITKMDGTNFHVHFSNGYVEKLKNLKEYRDFLRNWKPKDEKEKITKRGKEE